MSKSNPSLIAARVIVGGVVIAVVSALVEAIGCSMPNTTCQLGVDVSAGYAAVVLGAVLVVGGITVLGAIAFPIGLALSRRNHLGLWSMSLIGALSALVPFLLLCMVAGISPRAWFGGPVPGIPLAVGGLFGGAFLWHTWFRHLTTRLNLDAQ